MVQIILVAFLAVFKFIFVAFLAVSKFIIVVVFPAVFRFILEVLVFLALIVGQIVPRMTHAIRKTPKDATLPQKEHKQKLAGPVLSVENKKAAVPKQKAIRPVKQGTQPPNPVYTARSSPVPSRNYGSAFRDSGVSDDEEFDEEGQSAEGAERYDYLLEREDDYDDYIPEGSEWRDPDDDPTAR